MTTSSTPTPQQPTILIIGSGNAGLSFQSALLANPETTATVQQSSGNATNSSLMPQFHSFIISKESFCIRPQLFFSYKFLLQPEKWNSQQQQQQSDHHFLNGFVEKLDPEKQEVTFVEKNETKTMHYDYCVLAVGGIPNWLHFQEEKVEETSLTTSHPDETAHSDLVSTASVSPLVQTLMKDYENMMVLRNTEEITYLEQWIRQKGMTEHHMDREIVVIGSGALSLDFVSNLVHGYLNAHENSQDGESQIPHLPRIRIITRSNTLAMPLMRDEKASDMIQEIASSEPFSNFISVCYEDEVDTLRVYHNEKTGQKIIDSVVTRNGHSIKCLGLVQATGVLCNTSLCESSGLKIGEKGGILVNEHFECQSDSLNIPNHSLFAVGDAVEFPLSHPAGKNTTAVWKNWTSSREQGQECANYSVKNLLRGEEMTSSSKKLVFNQTLRLFELYVSCLGMYESEACFEPDYIYGENKSWMMKLQFLPVKKDNSSEEAEASSQDDVLYELVGALILGNKVSHFQIGNHLLQLIRYHCRFNTLTRQQLVSNIEKFNFSHCVTNLQMHQEFLTEIPKKKASKKKFKNPLLRKKKKKKAKSGEGKEQKQ